MKKAVNEGDEIKVQGLRTFEDFFKFYATLNFDNSRKIYDKIWVIVSGLCNVRDDDRVIIDHIKGVGFEIWKGQNGWNKQTVIQAEITNLTPPPIEW